MHRAVFGAAIALVVGLSLWASRAEAIVAQGRGETVYAQRGTPIELRSTGANGSVTYSIVAQPTNGSVTVVGNIATYTPSATSGVDSFVFEATDSVSSATATMNLTILANTGPSVSSVGVALGEMGSATATAQITDPDPFESFTGRVDFGDGSAEVAATITGTQLSAAHTFMANGPRNVNICVADVSGAEACASRMINVVNAPLLVDLALSVVNAPAKSLPSSPIVYQLEVVNLGPQVATNVTLSTSLPESAAFRPSGSSDFCAQAELRIDCLIDSLAVGVSETITIVVSSNSANALLLDLTVNADEPDTNAANDTVRVETGLTRDQLGEVELTTKPKGGCHSTPRSASGSLLPLLVALSLLISRRRRR